MISKRIRPTYQLPPPDELDGSEPLSEPITAPTDNVHNVYIHCFENPLYDDRNTIGVDLPSRYPDKSFDGYKRIYVMHDSITNCINVKGLKSKKADELLQGFEVCYSDLKRNRFIAHFVKLDNE